MEDLVWSELDILSEEESLELYGFLSENYVSNKHSEFSLCYSKDFLVWALTSPGWKKEFHIGLRDKTQNNKLVAFISGIPTSLKQFREIKKNLVVNFLCINQNFRTQKLSLLLIEEITKRAIDSGLEQALYTGNTYRPSLEPIISSHYYHKSLNPKKLQDNRFINTMTPMQLRLHKLFYSKNTNITNDMRPLEEKDIPTVTRKLNETNKSFQIAQSFREEEVKHWFLKRNNVVYSYVSKDLSDFVSFYSISIATQNENTSINSSYLFHYYSKNVSTTEKLLKKSLVLAKKENFDIFNCIDIGQNTTFIELLNFDKGNATLYYHLYDHKNLPKINKTNLNIILL